VRLFHSPLLFSVTTHTHSHAHTLASSHHWHATEKPVCTLLPPSTSVTHPLTHTVPPAPAKSHGQRQQCKSKHKFKNMGNKLDKEKGRYVFFSIPQPVSLLIPTCTHTHLHVHPVVCTPSCTHPQLYAPPVARTSSCTHTHPLVRTPTHNLSFLNLTVLLQIHSLLPSLG
jgi:hypothetical protein